MRIGALSAALLLGGAPITMAQSGRQTDSAQAAAEVRAVDQARSAAILHGDTAALSRIWAPEYTQIYADGSVRSRAERLTAMARGPLPFDSLEVEAMQVRLYGTVAVVTARDRAWARGASSSQRMRFTRVYVQRDGRWQLVTSQATLLSGAQ
jgi:ketosteroid isomerase-like protein